MIRIRLFGQLRISFGERSHTQLPPSKEHHLLSYLLLHRDRPHSRSVLATLLWGDSSEARARKCLRTSLWRVRRALETEGGSRGTYLLTGDDQVRFNTRSPYWLDVEEFERSLLSVRPTMHGLEDHGVRVLTRAVELYRADLLEGCYEDWCLLERERLRELLLRALRVLADHHIATHSYDGAIDVGQRMLRHDPLSEPGHRLLMYAYCLAGERGAALRQYQSCQDLLTQELRVEPAEATVALAEQIRAGTTIDGGARSTEQPDDHVRLALTGAQTGESSDGRARWSTAVQNASSDLHLIQAELRHLHARVQQSITSLERVRQELQAAGLDSDRTAA